MKYVNQESRLQVLEKTDELIGVLTAISIVSKRLAKNLALLQESKEGVPIRSEPRIAPSAYKG